MIDQNKKLLAQEAAQWMEQDKSVWHSSSYVVTDRGTRITSQCQASGDVALHETMEIEVVTNSTISIDRGIIEVADLFGVDPANVIREIVVSKIMDHLLDVANRIMDDKEET